MTGDATIISVNGDVHPKIVNVYTFTPNMAANGERKCAEN